MVAIGVVVALAWAGRRCPLTVWEHHFRVRAGEAGYTDGFIEEWVGRLLYYHAPSWVFTVI